MKEQKIIILRRIIGIILPLVIPFYMFMLVLNKLFQIAPRLGFGVVVLWIFMSGIGLAILPPKKSGAILTSTSRNKYQCKRCDRLFKNSRAIGTHKRYCKG